MKRELKNLQLLIDGYVELVKELKTTGMIERKQTVPSLQLIRAIDSLQLAKGWVGQLLGEIGEASPYANDGKRKEIKDIEPADATINFNNVTFGRVGNSLRMVESNSTKADTSITHVEKVDWLREEIKVLIKNTEHVNLSTLSYKVGAEIRQGATREANICRTQVWINLTEARMYLGFELGRLRDESIS